MTSCTICIEDVVKEGAYVKSECGHVFHLDCFNKYINYDDVFPSLCPKCKTALKRVEVISHHSRWEVLEDVPVKRFCRYCKALSDVPAPPFQDFLVLLVIVASVILLACMVVYGIQHPGSIPVIKLNQLPSFESN